MLLPSCNDVNLYIVSPKKYCTKLVAVTLSILNGFSKSFHSCERILKIRWELTKLPPRVWCTGTTFLGHSVFFQNSRFSR